MKSLLICPSERQGVAALAEQHPLAILPLLGKTLVDYWLEHLVEHGAKEAVVLSDDRAPQIAAYVEDGARWGLKVAVQHEVTERTVDEARNRYKVADNTPWLGAPDDVIFMDRLPPTPDRPLFTSYAAWFAAGIDWLPHAATPDRVGIRVIKLGVWAGLHTRIAPTAELHAPCWIGDNVYIGDGAIVGPNVIVEERAFIEPRAIVRDSHIGPNTFIGAHADVEHSIALGSTLINWKYDSVLKVPDEFLLCSLDQPQGAVARLLKTSVAKQPEREWTWKFNAKTGL